LTIANRRNDLPVKAIEDAAQILVRAAAGIVAALPDKEDNE
jgi:hypothetical protein